MVDPGPLPHRRIRFAWPDDTRARWQPLRPEFAAAVNALSLGMPHGEPYVMRAVRRAAGAIDDPDVQARVRAYLAQEAEHSRQHARFNEILVAHHPALARVESWLATSYRFLERRAGAPFGTAYAAAFEATAFAAARWMDRRRHELFTGADPEAATLILWHLAEEVEHKTVAHEVWAAVDGSRLRYVAAMGVCFAMLVWFVFCGTVVQLAAWRRLWSPVAWFRLWRWGLGFVFEVVPTMAITVLPGHDPAEQADPSWMPLWLSAFDPDTGTLPVWDAPLDAYLAATAPPPAVGDRPRGRTTSAAAAEAVTAKATAADIPRPSRSRPATGGPSRLPAAAEV
ncbi:MAG: metal-dependent hydrolase [Actinomyces sp.]|nr:MAG: metal-dependent hydrolase [Actinomyces sp.]